MMDSNWPVWSVFLLWSLLSSTVASYKIGDLRLVDGPTPNAGRLEFYLGFRGWYTTCDVNWDIDDAIVACRQLGFPGAALARTNSHYGRGVGVPLARDWQCRGDEDNLQDCDFIPKPRCEETVGVVCQAPGYMGCYADSDGILKSTLQHRVFTLDHMSLSACRHHCKASHSKLAGLKNGRECYCGDFYEALLPINRESDRHCQVPCTGNPDEICGGQRSAVRSFGPDILSVYDLTLGACEQPTQPVRGRVMGNAYSYGDVIHFQCEKGYQIQKSKAATAQCVMVVDGVGKSVRWNTSVPICQAMVESEPRMAHEDQIPRYDSVGSQYIVLAILGCIIMLLTGAILFLIIKRKIKGQRATRSSCNAPPCYEDLVPDYERILDPKTGVYPIDRSSYYQSLKPAVPNRPPRYTFRINVPGHPSYPESLWRL